MENREYYNHLHDVRWQKKRNLILERDNYTCQCCGSNDNFLHVHHLNYIKKNGKLVEPWDYPDELLVSLCEDCHRACHEERKSAENIHEDIREIINNIHNAIIDAQNNKICTNDRFNIISSYFYDIGRITRVITGDVLKDISGSPQFEEHIGLKVALDILRTYKVFMFECEKLSQNYFEIIK